MQAGAKYIAEDRGAFERGGGPVVSTTTSQQAAASAPLRVPMIECLDTDSLVEVAGMLGCSVKELELRYGAGAAGALKTR